ncbi:hypothetical protein J2S76_004175 [Ancylobacter vacuolatus]|uniref:Uncharacterized protein n=1 Tax=Ancylobacter vacuolatus TaxID=223389 RepID=A0ABU0DMT0_9HYPH|nr:hypothetical protein [Ancylobacter vacuolatus]MDQ0349724.1 hypothetical protein [Ancylobacter vacuolatus]
MRLIPNWRRVLLRAWSVRLGLLAGLCEGVNVALQITIERLPEVSLALRLAAGLAACAALAARFIAQSSIHED